MNPYSLPPLISSILFLLIGGFCFLKNRKSVVNLTFSLLCLATIWWQFSWFILFNTKAETLANFVVKLGYTGIIFIPITFSAGLHQRQIGGKSREGESNSLVAEGAKWAEV